MGGEVLDSLVGGQNRGSRKGASMEDKDQNVVDLGTVPRDLNLMILRASAIEAYGGLEQSLSRLFAELLGTTPDKASIVFLRS
jgi:hypothetical protein